MIEIKCIKRDLEKLKLLSELYNDILVHNARSDEELETQRLKMQLAKKEMLTLNYRIHKYIEQMQTRL